VIYSLTDYGNTVLPMLDMVRLWGLAHIERGAGSALDVNCSENHVYRPQ
jgi:DNA-binding HxlR family transcriptional regulator